jgi:DNA-binding LytR/AlgR family response regulator
MPGMTGIEAAGAIGDACHVVFITAYNEYAVDAFEHGAVDYVLKPARARAARDHGRPAEEAPCSKPSDLGELLTRLSAKLDSVEASPATTAKNHLQWIQASVGQQLRLIPVAEILFFTSDEKYTRVQTETFEALIRKPTG